MTHVPLTPEWWGEGGAMARILQRRYPVLKYDTVSADEIWKSRTEIAFGNGLHIGNQALTNMQVAGMMPMGEWFLVQKLSVGAPKGVLPTWSQCNLTLKVGNTSVFNIPVHAPPDDLSAIAEDVGAEVDETSTPLNWEYVGWTLGKPIQVDPLQRYDVRVDHYGNGSTMPAGSIRIYLKGLVSSAE